MKFTYNWLKQYVDFAWTASELAERLTFAGVEVEEVVNLGGKVPDPVVVAQVLASEKHPNADRLSVCRVTDGSIERQIVCGAKNYQVGDKVPLALPGAVMAGGFTIKISKLRGVESQGMMCSAEELGLPKGADGLLILPAETPLGIKLADALGGAETVYDVEITPNRPDWLSVIGIAREIAAITGNPLRLPEIALSENADPVENFASVTVAAADLCPRYTARVIRGVKIGPSPAWLKQALEKVGMRSINNVVDVTNYVLLECGQPLHAFDYNLLADHRIVVRRAEAGERFLAIDGSGHELTGEMLVIADAQRPVALAGIMGGQESEINERTTDVLLESAWFLPRSIRRTSKRLGLASESSYRFERGADLGGVVWASNRAAALIQQVAGGQVTRGVIDVMAQPLAPRRVRCRFAQVNRLLGIDVPPATVQKIFTGLGLTVAAADSASCEVTVPSFRVDLEREADLIEEVCRIHGVEKIPARMQPATAAVSAFDTKWDALGQVRAILTALGFHEAVNQTLGSEGVLKLQNPLSADQHALRSSLVPGLLGNLRTNVSRHQFDLRLFEIGRVFAADGSESLHLAVTVTGRREPHAWEPAGRAASLDFYDLKGVLAALAEQLRISDWQLAAKRSASGPAGTLLLGQTTVGELRQVETALAKKLDLRAAVFVAEMELDALLGAARREKQFRELPKFPAIARDMALVVDEAVTHGEILAALAAQQNKCLERVELFDIFRGGSIPQGRKSLAYSLTFRAAERTLTDAEVNEAHEQLKRELQRVVHCEIRES